LKYKKLVLILCSLLQLSCGKDGGLAPRLAGSVVSVSRENIIFVTTSTYDGNLGGIAGADSKCNTDIGKPSNSGIFKALIVGSTRVACTTTNCVGGAAENVDWPMTPDTTYTRSDGTIIGTTNSSSIFIGALDNQILPTSEEVMTGLNTGWVASDNCTDWSDSNAHGYYYGFSDRTNSTSYSYSVNYCGILNRLYCVSQ